jgi:hypothetical protein
MHSTTSNGLAAANNQPAKNHTTDNIQHDYLTDSRLRKEEQTLIALFALAGHVVHRGRYEDYIVCKFGHSRYCQDLNDLHVFAMRVGLRHA